MLIVKIINHIFHLLVWCYYLHLGYIPYPRGYGNTAMLWLRRRNRQSNGAKLGRRDSCSLTKLEIGYIAGLLVGFDYDEIVAATENFQTEIGSGGFGTLYKGTLEDQTVVAVKKITGLGAHGKKEFCTEIAIIGKVHHVNMVTLKGFCAQGFLVLEFMSWGSLDRTLFGNGPVLEWKERFGIALGTARGLAYLHSGCEHKIIHCDVKPKNILLDDNLQVKISDFGLSKLPSPEQSDILTSMRGTQGYLARRWLTNCVVSDKIDIYSYGMALLELVRGKRNWSLQILSRTPENGNGLSSSNYFPLFALEMHEEGRYLELVDPRLEGRAMIEEVEKLVWVALCCVHEEPMLRPTMANIVGMLEGGLPMGEPPVESLNFLRFYGWRFTYNVQNEVVLNPQENATLNTTASSLHNSCSYMSSQQVSGPR